MILTKEDYDELIQIQLSITRIINNAVMSDLEEKHEKEFEKFYITSPPTSAGICKKQQFKQKARQS